MHRFIKIPDKLKKYINEFTGMFTKPSFTSFSQLMFAIPVCDKAKNVYNLYDTMAVEDKKARSSYNWFFNDARWDEDLLAERKADMFFKALDVKKNDQILFIVDDTYEEKKGNDTEGVGRFYDHSKGCYIWGNRFITSVIQCKGLFIPHKAKMYIKEEDTEDFRTGFEIAFDDMILPFKTPEETRLMVVIDSWWFSVDFVTKCRGLNYHVTGQLKSNKEIVDNGITINVSEYAQRFEKKDYKRIELMVRGKKRAYWAIDKVVEIEGIGKVKLVISRKSFEKDPRYYFSTDAHLTAYEVLDIYENRWNIETAHREANQKLGFKDYQMRSEKAIERFIQMVFAMWTLLLISDLEAETTGDKRVTMGEKIEAIRATCFIDMFKYIIDVFNLPLPIEKMIDTLKEFGYKT